MLNNVRNILSTDSNDKWHAKCCYCRITSNKYCNTSKIRM